MTAADIDQQALQRPDLHDRITDAYYGKMGDDFARSTRDRIHWICSQVSGRQVLDVGCSQGIAAIILGREGKSVIGVDPAKRSIAEAQAFLEQESLRTQKRVKFVHGDFLTADWSRESFDTIIMAEILEHLVQPEAFIAKASTLLSPGGKLIVTVPFGINDSPDHKQTFYLTAPWKMLSPHFEVTDLKIFGKWIGFVGERRAEVDLPPPLSVAYFEAAEAAEAVFQKVERDLLDRIAAAQNATAQKAMALKAHQTSHTALQQEAEKTEASRLAAESALSNLRAKESELQSRIDDLLSEKQRFRDLNVKSQAKIDSLKDALVLQRDELETRVQGYLSQINALSSKVDEQYRVSVDLEKRLTLAEYKRDLEVKDRKKAEWELGQASERARDARERMTALDKENVEAIRNSNQKIADIEATKDNLKTSLDKSQKESGDLKKRITDLKREILALSSRVRLIEKQKVLADERADRQRETLSFKLGHTFIFGLKSWTALCRMPKDLIMLGKEAKERRLKNKRSSISRKSLKKPLADEKISSEPIPVNPIKEFPAGIVVKRKITELKVACIMDDFTYLSFSPECNLEQLTPDNWEQEISTFSPDMLFIESAWRGKNDSWGNKVGHLSREMLEIFEWCRARNVPTAFWNKEDPVHFETFLATASQFDVVFTTDIDCIGRYKAALGHNNVFLLPFACQPRNQNPIERFDRKDAFCFAGAYYVKYPERTRDLDGFVSEFPEFKPFEIYDRNYGKDNPDYQFPPEYQSYIVGTLPFVEIDTAYKGYRYAINLNSVKQSQSMFARRVYELLASNTMTISNFSRGLRLVFGDLVISSDNAGHIVDRIKAIEEDDVYARKFQLAGLRKVLQEHTYGERFKYIVSKLNIETEGNDTQKVAIIGTAENSAGIEILKNNFKRQNHTESKLFIIVPNSVTTKSIQHNDDQITLISKGDSINRVTQEVLIEFDFVAGFSSRDYYGPNYLSDLLLATHYVDSSAIGKSEKYIVMGDTVSELQQTPLYEFTTRTAFRCCIVKCETIDNTALKNWISNIDKSTIDIRNSFIVDEFNYCKDAAASCMNLSDVSIVVDDIADLHSGWSISDLTAQAEKTPPSVSTIDEDAIIKGAILSEGLTQPKDDTVTWSTKNGVWKISSTLEDGKHIYLYQNHRYNISDFMTDGEIKLNFDVTPGLNVSFVMKFFTDKDESISHKIITPNRNELVDIPDGTSWIKVGYRIYSSGKASVNGLNLGGGQETRVAMSSGSKTLILTNHYPSYDDLYRNGFVHARARAYREKGINVDVFRLRDKQNLGFHEFEGVDCITGSAEQLDKMLSQGAYDRVLVHFLDSEMWEVLSRYIDRLRVKVWVHGAEVQPWWRRTFNYSSELELKEAKAASDTRLAFWRALFSPLHPNLQFVFVSRYFADTVFEDLNITCPVGQYHVIHNPIDDLLFAYHSKPNEQRGKILSIRPFASAKYANDLSVKAILALKHEDFFDQLEFLIVGEGRLFEEITAPLKGLANVTLERRFLHKTEIAALHREYGVFLNPTRFDSQGVSRDEAMSSGLVPITSNNSAIPEFVDDRCGYLVETEDADGLARAVTEMWKFPEIFAAKSRAAAERVRNQSALEQIIDMELSLLK